MWYKNTIPAYRVVSKGDFFPDSVFKGGLKDMKLKTGKLNGQSTQIRKLFESRNPMCRQLDTYKHKLNI